MAALDVSVDMRRDAPLQTQTLCGAALHGRKTRSGLGSEHFMATLQFV